MRRAWIAAGLVVAACGQTAAHEIPLPVAGLVHPQIARVGTPVAFDGSTSAVAQVGNVQGHLTRFRLAIADGTAAVDLGAPATQHVFTAPGDYGVELTVQDDRGRLASVRSTIRVVDDFVDLCAAPTDCAGAPCLGGACAVLACGGDAACPASVTGANVRCNRGLCDQAALPPGDPDVGGQDAGSLALDGH